MNSVPLTTTIDDVIEELLQTRQCIQCRALFTEMESLGAAQCWRHTGALQSMFTVYDSGILGTYTCCGVSPHGWHRAYDGPDAALGCVRYDHSDDAAAPDNITMSYERAAVLFGDRLESRNVLYDERLRTITIQRHLAATSQPRRVLVVPTPRAPVRPAAWWRLPTHAQ